VEEYFATCPWMNDESMDESMDEKKDELYYECYQQMLFLQKLNKRNKVKTIYVGFFQNNLTNEIFKSHFKAILHISLI
jgi:hypothetical protein